MHYTRSYTQNRERAIIILRQKLDQHLHGSESILARERREASERKAWKKARSRERMEKKRLLKEKGDATRDDVTTERTADEQNHEKT